MGISNVWARVGSMIAPLVKITGEVQPFIPNLVYGSIALLGGCAAIFLPETLNRPLPETLEDMENWSVPCLCILPGDLPGERSNVRAFFLSSVSLGTRHQRSQSQNQRQKRHPR